MTDVQEAPSEAPANKYPSESDIDACLIKAAGIMREHGQCKGMLSNSAGNVCMAESIARAAGGMGSKLYAAGMDRVQDCFGKHTCDVNNAPDQTTEGAALALEKAAAHH